MDDITKRTKGTSKILDEKLKWVIVIFEEYSRNNWAIRGEIHSLKFGKGCGLKEIE